MVQTLAGRDVRDGICSASDIQGRFAQNEFGPSFRKKKLLSLQSHSLNKLFISSLTFKRKASDEDSNSCDDFGVYHGPSLGSGGYPR
jgi:hypothetical protein